MRGGFYLSARSDRSNAGRELLNANPNSSNIPFIDLSGTKTIGYAPLNRRYFRLPY
jgi:hypothetical protein